MSDTTTTPATDYAKRYAPGTHPDLAPPPGERGIVKWLRENLFSGPVNTILTLLGFAFLVWALPPVITWAFLTADWVGTSSQDCTSGGACWAVITQRFEQFIFGYIPDGTEWRWTLAFILLGVALAPLLFWDLPYRKYWLYFTLAYPVLAVWLLYGGLGLTTIPTDQWGGFALTFVIGITGIVFSLPLGILLALGRVSKLPAVSMLCTIFIEVVRAVPLITVLFMSSVMLPLFLPEGVTFDKLVRALIVVSLFAAAYMAEVVRGGLQGIPKGQYEAAQAMGLSYWQAMFQIILPQALKIVIPGIVNNFIALFKDTTLVAIIGLFDLLGVGRAALADQNWLGLSTEVYVFVGLLFWIFCFGMSRYSVWLEKRLETGH